MVRRMAEPRAGMGVVENKKDMLLCPESDIDYSVVQLVTWPLYRLSYRSCHIQEVSI
jgi:hypothetical protein